MKLSGKKACIVYDWKVQLFPMLDFAFFFESMKWKKLNQLQFPSLNVVECIWAL